MLLYENLKENADNQIGLPYDTVHVTYPGYLELVYKMDIENPNIPKGKLKKDYASAVKVKRSIEAFKDSLYEQKLNEGMDKRQAGELIKQLGGGRFIAMTGAKDFVVGPKGATFKIGKNAKSISHVRIDLENDLYNVEFLLVRGTNIRVKSYFKHIYFDQLRDLFEKETGLRTSL